MAVAAAIGAAVSIGGGLIASSKAASAARGARNDKRSAQAKMESIKNSRQAIVNPYAGTKSLAGMASDLSSMVNNPFAQLGVATPN